MEKEILQRFQPFRLQEVEEGRLLVAEEEIQGGKEEWLRSLVGKILGEKPINFTGVRRVFTSLWSDSGLLKIRELGSNLYLFVFDTQDHKLKVLHGKAWTFESQFLLLKPWSEEMDLSTERFTRVHLWVQVWNLPSHWLSKAFGFKFKQSFGQVLDVIIPDYGSRKGLYMKLLVELDLEKPLPRGLLLHYNGKDLWAEFKYENMGQFCFYCGHVGHVDRYCAFRKRDALENKVLEGQYGEWMISGQPRMPSKRIESKGADPAPKVQTVESEAHQELSEGWKQRVGANTPELPGSDQNMAAGGGVTETIAMQEPRDLALVQVGRDMIGQGEETMEILEQVRVYEAVERGEASHSSFQAEAPISMMELVAQEEQAIAGGHLINIPVDLSASRGVLQEVTVKASESKKRETQTRGKTVKGTWKRAKGKENLDQNNSGTKSTMTEAGGKKRQWMLQDEAEELCARPDQLKRPKGVVVSDPNYAHQVGVASLEWPQMDQ